MTDEETKKALECCVKDDYHKCERFKVGDSRIEHKDKMLSDALDLINRKDAEIDILKTEIEKLKNLVADKGGLILMETAKAEAIKEFAFDLTEEVKEINTSNRSEDKDDIIIHVLDIIDNLVKEKVEDKAKE